MSTDTKTKDDKQAPSEPEPFHIVCSDNNQGPYIRVGICVNQPLRDFLREGNIADAYLLVVVRDGAVAGEGEDNDELLRKLVPLSDGFAHVTFTRPGAFIIETMVIWPDGCSKRQLERLVLEDGDFGGYKHQLKNSYAEADEPQTKITGVVGISDKKVTLGRTAHVSRQVAHVFEENFAKPPARWRVAMVGWFFASKNRDQCQLRRRTLPSLVMVPLVLVPHYLLKLVVLVVYSVLGLVYGLQFKYVLRPFREGSLKMVFEDVEMRRTAWYYHRTNQRWRFERRSPLWIVSFTALWVGLALSAFFSGSSSLSFWEAVIVVGKVFGLIAAIGGMVLAAAYFIDSELGAKVADWYRRRKAEKQLTHFERLQRELLTMSCDVDGQPMTIDRLIDRRRRAPVVVYHNIKQKVCKPFAR